jgi:hypothetical protein
MYTACLANSDTEINRHEICYVKPSNDCLFVERRLVENKVDSEEKYNINIKSERST